MATHRPTVRRKQPNSTVSAIGKVLKGFFVVVCVVVAVGFGYVGAKIWKQLHDLPDITLVERYEPIEAIQLFDRNDHMICTVEGDEDRRVVPLNQISLQMQQAMLAAEDHHFYEHHGVNVMSIIRASLANLQAGHVVEGGSTITQQLVKNLFFTEAQRTMDRKVKEAFVAYELEHRYPKERILEMYLNQVYFGNNAYGIERAASRYFNKTAAELTVAQASFLAGLVKAPSELGTQANRKAAISRQHEILDKMVEYGYITANQANTAKKQQLVFKKGANPLQKYPYYVSHVLETLRDRFSQAEMRRQGLRVYTNLDPQAQEIAEKTLAADIAKAPKGVTQAALVSVSVQDGAVIAMVGGVGDFWKHQFNRATNPHTAGSSFKPFVYLTALLKGVLTPDSIIEDTPLVIHQPYGLPDYAPKNFDHRFLGRIPLRKALALSRNVCSVRIAQLVGIDSVVETAREAGITTKLEPNLSLALGSSAVTPLDMAGAYATFARMGVAIKPQVLRRIENNRGQVIEVFQASVDKVFPVEPVARLVSMMQDVVKFGTGTGAKLDDRPVAGKTGTADAAKDIWFVGFTPDMVTALWGGNDENLPIKGNHVTGGDVMAKIWKHYNEAYYIAHPAPAGSFVPPSAPTEEEQKREQKAAAKLNQKVVKSDTAVAPVSNAVTVGGDLVPAVQTPVEVNKVEMAPAPGVAPSISDTPKSTEEKSTSAPSPAPERSTSPAPTPTPAPSLTPGSPTPTTAPTPAGGLSQ
ncbi:MAG: PBP1A family penicillin-binding protein [Candidatus Melainabacteria bacterium]|nr:MAG: PBP1A family penicillin-binding protein [Candidatus Melainabacteria bacterium]